MNFQYNTLILLTEDENIINKDINFRMMSALKKVHPIRIEETASVQKGQILTALWENWSVSLHYSDESYVLEESEEIAKNYAHNRGDKNIIKNCRARIELSSDIDIYGEHFNDYITVLEQIEIEFRGAILFDTRTEQFI